MRVEERQSERRGEKRREGASDSHIGYHIDGVVARADSGTSILPSSDAVSGLRLTEHADVLSEVVDLNRLEFVVLSEEF